MNKLPRIAGCLALAAAAIVARAEVKKGLVAQYPLDEGKGHVALDVSGNASHGRIHGAHWVTDEFGTALEFDGSGDCVDCGRAPALDVKHVTVAAWILPKRIGGGLVSRHTGGGWGDQRLVLSYLTWGGSRELGWIVANGGTHSLVVVKPPRLGLWTHVAATADGTKLRLYLNGKPAGTAEQRGIVPKTKDVPLRIGKSAGLGTACFRGLIDDVKVYDRALSAAEIVALYASERDTRKEPATGERVLTVGPVRDTVLDEQHPSWNYGRSPRLTVGTDARSLLTFDLRRIPHTSLVMSAKLRLYLDDGRGDALEVTVDRMKAQWNEGARNGAAASSLEPTWQHHLFDKVPWEWPSDRACWPETVGTVARDAKLGWSEFDVTRMAADWVADPLNNAGVLLCAKSAGLKRLRKAFASREASRPERQPQLVVVYQPPVLESTEATGGPPRLVVGTSKAVPLVNTPVTLRAKAPGWSGEPLSFSFTDYPVNFPGEPTAIGDPTVAAGEKLVEQPWTPANNGLHNILVTAKAAGKTRFKVWLRVPVLVKEMTFYGGYRRRRYINLLCSDDYKEYAYWKARGVRCLGWAVGTQANLRGRKTSPDEYLASWERGRQKYSRGADGIMIDEMFGDQAVANITEAIRRYRKQFPERLICPYATGVGPVSGAVFKDCADLVMIESYSYSPRAYWACFDRRFGTAVKHGIERKSIASICAGDNYVTTNPEIRRQARYIRRMSPDVMPGVAMYSGISNPALIPFFDKAIEDYWLGPVLFVKRQKDMITIRNIGQTDAPSCCVIYTVGPSSHATFVQTPALPAQGRAIDITLPKGVLFPRVAPPVPWVHVIHAEEDFGAIPRGKMQPFTLKPVTQSFSENFDAPPKLAITKSKEGFVERGHLGVPASEGRSFTLSFDVSFRSIAIYAGINVQAGTKADGPTRNRIGLDFNRSDDDRDIRTGRTHFSYVKKEGERYRSTTHETMMRPIELKNTYRFFMHYEKGSHVRAVAKIAGKPVWDTGPLTIGPNSLSIDEIRFRVRPYKASSLSFENRELRMKLGDRVTGGWTDALVDSVEIRYMDD